MKAAAIVLPVLAIGAAVGWLAPGSGGPGVAGLSAPQGISGPAPAEAASVADGGQWPAGEVPLTRAADGHFYAEVAVDDLPMRMLVDTGASVIALTGADAEALGIMWRPEDVDVVGQGAGGPVEGVRILLDRVAIGELEARQVEAVVVPEGLGVSLLGQSFLSSVKRVEVQGDTMLLGG